MERRARLSSPILFSTCWSEINVPQRNFSKFTMVLRRKGEAQFSPEEMILGPLMKEKKLLVSFGDKHICLGCTESAGRAKHRCSGYVSGYSELACCVRMCVCASIFSLNTLC